MFVDSGMLSYGIYVGDESTSLLYPIYLWVIFGNGFRFGLAVPLPRDRASASQDFPSS